MKRGWFITSKCGRWMRNILKGATLTSLLFIVQACYGTGTPWEREGVKLQGKVVSKATGEPIKGIKVSFNDYGESSLTDENGMFVIYTWATEYETLLIKDIDGEENGSYYNAKKEVKLLTDQYVEISLQEK